MNIDFNNTLIEQQEREEVKKKKKKNLIFLMKSCFLMRVFAFIVCFSFAPQAYYFWFVSSDWSLEDMTFLEEEYYIKLPLLGYIFDHPDIEYQLSQLEKIATTLWTWRIYTLTLSPYDKTATAVANGEYDEQYLLFFDKIKSLGMKVIFRTMHEMNGGRYPRASNPSEFKRAWQHVRELSRMLELDQNSLLFDFSVNHRDMPTKGFPNQNAVLFQCNQNKHPTWEHCPVFEDYYPGDDYVDVVWVSFYNWGKANSNRLRLSPQEILYDKNRNTFERLKKFQKPIMIDEVGTSSIWYNGAYSPQKTRDFYQAGDFSKKEEWLEQLKTFLVEHPEIWGVSYFNIDYTNGYLYNAFWEWDWAIVDFPHNRLFQGFFSLLGASNLDKTQIFSLFQTENQFFNQWWNSSFDTTIPFQKEENSEDSFQEAKEVHEPSNFEIDTTVSLFEQLIKSTATNNHEEIQMYQDLQNISFDDDIIDQSIQYLAHKYQHI